MGGTANRKQTRIQRLCGWSKIICKTYNSILDSTFRLRPRVNIHSLMMSIPEPRKLTGYFMRRGRIPLIPYTMFQEEKIRKCCDNPFNLTNWSYEETNNHFVCRNGQDVTFRYMFKRTNRYGFTYDFNIHGSEGCSNYPLRALCTKAENGRHREVWVNIPREEQKE